MQTRSARPDKLRAMIAVVAVLSIVGGGVLIAQWNSPQAASAAAQPAAEHVEHAKALSKAFRAVAKKLRPSVVSVRAERTVQPAGEFRRNGVQPEIPEEFRRFFDEDSLNRMFRELPNRSFRQQGNGSGVIVSKDGYIVTNNHVVRGANEVRVTLHDNRSHRATVVGADPKTDVAVLKVEADGLTPATIGDSDAMDVGDWVLAIGSPFRLNQTVTAGIVSATGRGNVGITDYEDFLQTDAAINSGNSGGPLVNLNGEVVGLNTAIASRSGGNAGVGFAIPSNMVKYVTNSIIETGRVERGRIGAGIQNLTPELARSFGYEFNGGGVLIGDVVGDGPAEKAGLKSGDIVVALNGRPMRNAAQLRNTIAGTKPGETVKLRIFRDGGRREVPVIVGKLNESQQQGSESNRPTPAGEAADNDLGLKLQNVTPELAGRLNLGERKEGVAATGVESGSIAAAAGFRAGDVIVSVNGRSVSDVADFREALKSQDLSQGIRLQVVSGGLKRFVFVRKS